MCPNFWQLLSKKYKFKLKRCKKVRNHICFKMFLWLSGGALRWQRKIVRSPGPASPLSPPEGATSLPPGLISFTPHTWLPTHHSQLVSICELFIHLTPIPLPGEISLSHSCVLYLPALTCACLYLTVFII